MSCFCFQEQENRNDGSIELLTSEVETSGEHTIVMAGAPAERGPGNHDPLIMPKPADHEDSHNGLDRVSVIPAGPVDIIFGIFGLVLYFMDVGTDINVAVKYFDNLDFIWGGLTVGFIVIAYIVTTLLNMGFYCLDEFKAKKKASRNTWIGRILLSLILSGGAQR